MSNIKNIGNILNIVILIATFYSVAQLFTPASKPFSENIDDISLTSDHLPTSYFTYSPIFPYVNSYDLPWVSTCPNHPLYNLVLIKESYELNSSLLSAAKRINELQTCGNRISEEEKIKQIQLYNSYILKYIKEISSITDKTQLISKYYELIINLKDHKKLLDNMGFSKIVIENYTSVINSIYELIPFEAKIEEDKVTYYPSEIVKAKQFGLYEITIKRADERWDKIYVDKSVLETPWNNNILKFNYQIESFENQIKIENPFYRSDRGKYRVEDMRDLPLIEATYISPPNNYSPKIEYNSTNGYVLRLNDIDSRQQELILSKLNSLWKIKEIVTISPRITEIHITYSGIQDRIKNIIACLLLLFLVFVINMYSKYAQILNYISQNKKLVIGVLLITFGVSVIVLLLFNIEKSLFFLFGIALTAVLAVTVEKIVIVKYFILFLAVLVGILHWLGISFIAVKITYLLFYFFCWRVIILLRKV